MSFTQRIFTSQECDKIYDLSQKVGSSSDKGKRFTFMDQSDSSDENQQQMVSNFYDTFFDMLAKNGLYSGSLVPDSSSTPNVYTCLLYTSPSPRDVEESRMPSSA